MGFSCCDKPLIPVVFSGCALFLSLLGNLVCQFVSFGLTLERSGRTSDIFFGIWYYKGLANVTTGNYVETIEVCKMYPSSTSFDSKWKSAKAFSIIAPVIGGVFWCWICFALCFEMSNSLWRKIGALFVLNTVFQGLTLLYLTSEGCLNNEFTGYIEELYPNITADDSCSMAWGAKTAIAATCCWFVAGVSMFVIDAPTRPERGPPETQTVTYTKTTQPDGTEVITSDVVKGKAVPAAETTPSKEEAPIAAEEDVEEFR
uniref:Uncharacterized protein n=1 Tax=Odontella aurita TaxID=265563 RepID=A0A7S4ILA9_9STRA|mmetsp:Transcript_26811/g.79239  ORF Transcript_26811/g.79239 Transcript_26811/m.79239 type:complete len:259 (+) Transcript_26811:370-1146(+)|eukprot:CAMPEP_0113534260 /NCGR_PEP_ID=MMETSP0015_2-20120614/5065_1 /TAXON_ID=2838 /ORGANISM="Odontella" /LENGTH=258 /DNA_ID=CAMNT_0000433411 /DNA_START=423 /DNA_END=1199 /DNA_ORIENTATION=+ /assembly_acc=CAM_ASM_000160